MLTLARKPRSLQLYNMLPGALFDTLDNYPNAVLAKTQHQVGELLTF
jgi:hypothetical protein